MFPIDTRHDRPAPREFYLRWEPFEAWLIETGRPTADVAAELEVREPELIGYFTGNTPAPQQLAIRLAHLVGIPIEELAQIRLAGGARSPGDAAAPAGGDAPREERAS